MVQYCSLKSNSTPSKTGLIPRKLKLARDDCLTEVAKAKHAIQSPQSFPPFPTLNKANRMI